MRELEFQMRLAAAKAAGWRFRWSSAGCHVTDPRLAEDDPGKDCWHAWVEHRDEVLDSAGAPSFRTLERRELEIPPDFYATVADKILLDMLSMELHRTKAKAEILRRLEMIDKLLAHCTREGGECSVCGNIVCIHGDEFHFHHDGCPSCY